MTWILVVGYETFLNWMQRPSKVYSWIYIRKSFVGILLIGFSVASFSCQHSISKTFAFRVAHECVTSGPVIQGHVALEHVIPILVNSPQIHLPEVVTRYIPTRNYGTKACLLGDAMRQLGLRLLPVSGTQPHTCKSTRTCSSITTVSICGMLLKNHRHRAPELEPPSRLRKLPSPCIDRSKSRSP